MTDFAVTWELIRGRFDNELVGLNQNQLNWRIHPNALTIGESALHVAGAEVNFVAQLLDLHLDEWESRIRDSATDSIVNDKPFPFHPDEIEPELVSRALQRAREIAGDTIQNPSQATLDRKIVSVLGPIIDGRGALARLAYHPGYHQGQVHMIKSAPDFPS